MCNWIAMYILVLLIGFSSPVFADVEQSTYEDVDGVTYKMFILDDDIKKPDFYLPMIAAIIEDSQDKIYFLIRDNNGGYVSGLNAILSAMDGTKAQKIFLVQGHAYSAAAFMLCFGDKVYLSDDVDIGFHGMTFERDLGEAENAEAQRYLKEIMYNHCVKKKLITKEKADKVMELYNTLPKTTTKPLVIVKGFEYKQLRDAGEEK